MPNNRVIMPIEYPPELTQLVDVDENGILKETTKYNTSTVPEFKNKGSNAGSTT